MSEVFNDSGFKLIELKSVKQNALSQLTFKDSPLIDLKFSANELLAVEALLDAIGEMAVAQTTKLYVSATKELELEVLKPIIAGRQRAINVDFHPSRKDGIRIKLFILQ